MTYRIRMPNAVQMIRKISIPHQIEVHFEPDDGLGSGRQALVVDGDIVEYIEKRGEWHHIRSIIIDDISNIRHFDGWIKRCDGLAFSRGNGLGDLNEDKKEGV